ncbi:hypothetical protein [Halovivax gelatinilyticus]|uniref:hypothetical protein n=1 Tax=Halovivax gelatinilyticus TaxID=2961597 RepID=UPI0020CA7472|nr:hypothetical protein [Halovivax gelatinilyticus]
MSTQAQSGGLTDKLPVKEGGIAGAVAFVAGLAVVSVFAFVDSEIEVGESEMGTLTELGQLFYASHYVDMEMDTPLGSETGSVFSDTSTQLPEFLFYAVPAVVLIGVGYWLASNFTDLSETNESVMAGASVVVGYLPLVVVGTFVFEHSESAEGMSVSFGPDLTQSLMFAGVAFPLIFGAIGGFIAYQQAQ